MTGKGGFKHAVLHHGQLRKGTPFVVDQVGIQHMTCATIKDRLLEDCAVDTPRTYPIAVIPHGVELPTDLTGRVNNLPYIRPVDNTRQGHFPCRGIDFQINERYHAVD